MKNIFKLFIVGLVTLTFASVSFAQATPATPAKKEEKKEEKGKGEEKGTKTQKKGEGKAKGDEKKDEKATK